MTFKETSDSWQMKVQSALRMPFPMPWIMIAAALFGIGYAILALFENDMTALRLLAIEATIIAALANEATYFETLLDEVADAFPQLLDEDQAFTEKWLKDWYDNIFWSKKNLIAGAVMGALVVGMGATVVPKIFTSTPGRAYAFLLDLCIGVLSGSLMWIMYGIARLTSSLGNKVHIRPSIFDSATSPLRAASSVLWKVSLASALLYLLGISTYPLCSITPDLFHLVVVVGAAVIMVLYFIVPQINIHKTLKGLKQERLGRLVKQIDKTFESVAANPTPENIHQLKELFHLQRVVNGKRSWSFGTGELLALIGSIVVPLFLFGLNYILARF